jgi:hypothetical protein
MMSAQIHVSDGFPFLPRPYLKMSSLPGGKVRITFLHMLHTGFEGLSPIVVSSRDVEAVQGGKSLAWPLGDGLVTCRPEDNMVTMSYSTTASGCRVQLWATEWAEACKFIKGQDPSNPTEA